MNIENVRLFLNEFAAGNHTEEEHREFIWWLQTSDMNDVEDIAEEYMAIAQNRPASSTVNKRLAGRIEQRLDRYDSDTKKAVEKVRHIVAAKRNWVTLAAAALVFALAGGAYLYFQNSKQSTTVIAEEKSVQSDVAPGGNHATLILANGSKISLDSAANGSLTEQGSTKVIKLESGLLTYDVNKLSISPGEVLYNTVETPRGGQYQITLPDGSKVWLNAASSLHFPTTFTGKERNVDLTGEGYFEVAKNAAVPFHVNVGGVKVEVLGTHFNVNAYTDEAAIKTTLLEGAVKISKGLVGQVLQPGQQAQVNKTGSIKIVNDIDTDEAVAWKNGLFQFQKADINTIMKQIGRWYNIDVLFTGKPSSIKITGKAPRNLSLSNLLKILELSEVNIKIEGNRITVQ